MTWPRPLRTIGQLPVGFDPVLRRRGLPQHRQRLADWVSQRRHRGRLRLLPSPDAAHRQDPVRQGQRKQTLALGLSISFWSRSELLMAYTVAIDRLFPLLKNNRHRPHFMFL